MIGKLAKFIGYIIIGFIVLVILSSILGGNKSGNTKVGDASSSSSPVKTEFKINEIVDSDGKQLTVTGIERNYSYQYYTKKAGKELVKVAVQLENKSKVEMSYGLFDFKMKDSAGDIKSNTYASVENELSVGQLAEGGKKTGNLIFEVPQDDANLTLIYSPSFWGTNKINVKMQ
jgi:Domain of unknown function (DUF4352)